MCGDMVRATLRDDKTQTRRVVKYIPDLGEPVDWCSLAQEGEREFVNTVGDYRNWCPHGVAGDRLWVRETWQSHSMRRGEVYYKADDRDIGLTWRPSIFMPRWASRILLEIVSVRVERVAEITEEDATAEGVDLNIGRINAIANNEIEPTNLRDVYRRLWDFLNAKRGFPWASNPFVWVLTFKRLGSSEVL